MKKFILLSTVFAAFFLLLAGEEKTPSVKDILDRYDKLYRSDTSYAEMEMIIKTPNWERTLKMRAWSETMEKTFITVLSPKKDKGISTLKKNKEMWNFFPKINKIMKIPPSMMMGSWMGSDFTNDDLVKESTMLEDYTGTLISPPEKDDAHYYIELTPKETTASVWGKIVITVRKSDYLPVYEEYYDEKGRKMRFRKFSEIKEMGGKIFPTVMEIIPLNKKGHSTKLIYSDAKFNLKLHKDTFTLRNLQKKR